MSTQVYLTVDVEDWYAGMAELGVDMPRPAVCASGLDGLAALVAGTGAVLTLFTVANYAPLVADELRALAEAGHEIASHGPDHGHLPEEYGALVDWLRKGREELEALVERPITGFRSPRFDVPRTLSLDRYRAAIAEAGFTYVSDTSVLGPASPVQEIPVLSWGRLPIGGGSYQRLFPKAVTRSAVDRVDKAVLYYHSYDFGATLPARSDIRSVPVAKQLLGRERVEGVFIDVLQRYGSEACTGG